MDNAILKKDKIKRLDFQLNQSYDALMFALEEMHPPDFISARNLYESDEGFLKAIISKIDNTDKNEDYMLWTRGTEQTNAIDRFVLQSILGMELSYNFVHVTNLNKNGMSNGHKITDNYDSQLITMIDNKANYKDIKERIQFSQNKNIFAVLNVLNYVRDTYKKPTSNIQMEFDF